MTTIIYRHLTKRLLFACLLVLLGLVAPLIIISLFGHLPAAALHTEFLWPALFGIAPAILYLVLPIAIGVATTWYYGNLLSESTLPVLYSAGFSVLSIATPAIVVALLGTAVGYSLSCFVAPYSARYLQDAVNVIENAPTPALLQPNRFYTLDGGRRVIYFEERLDKDSIGGVFMREFVADEEKTFTARRATFVRRDQETLIVLIDGNIQTHKVGDSAVETINFDRIVQASGLSGAEAPKRNWTGEFELSTPDFLRARAEYEKDPAEANRWKSEALKRFAVPPLAIVHALLGLMLVTIWGNSGGRGEARVVLACFVIASIHIAIMIATEALIPQDGRLVWPVLGLMGAELTLALVLLARQQWRRAGA
jgi:lipopolysaccharide export system permease protein